MPKALEMTPSDAGLAEAPWPPATANKRGESVLAGEGFEAFCARTKCTFADLMACNFELDINDPALKGKWQKVVNYYIRTKLGATEQQLTPGGNYKLKGGETLYVPTATQSAKKYLIVYKQFETVVPELLRESIKKKVVDEFSSFEVELDFSGSRAHHDLLVTFTQEIPIWTAFGESSR